MCKLPRARGSSNLKAKRKRLSIVFAMLFATKQGADRAEQAQAIGCDYATGAEWRLQKIPYTRVCGIFYFFTQLLATAIHIFTFH